MIDYYQISNKASETVAGHAGLEELMELSRKSKKVLEVGCGEGTRLFTMVGPNKRAWGVDVNPKAIFMAKKRFPKINFSVARGESLGFSSNTFDLVYSTFTIEHCSDPEKFLSEMCRVVKVDGLLALICPNYGAPNRRSPNSRENAAQKLLVGFFKDFNLSKKKLMWKKVTPNTSYNRIDDDTTHEPYLGTLQNFIQSRGFQILRSSSLWSLEHRSFNPRKLLTFFLGKIGIFPFKLWGPQIYLLAKKKYSTNIGI